MAKTPGPIPNAVRRRRNKDLLAPVKQGERRGITVEQPQPSPHWVVPVRNYFRAALNSGQSAFLENSDLALLTVQCDMLDRIYRSGRLVPVYKEERDADGNFVQVLDEDGNPIPLLDQYGEPEMRFIGSLNGQALKAVLDMSASLLVSEGDRRRLRIDLSFPKEDEEAPEKAIVAKQRKSLAQVAA